MDIDQALAERALSTREFLADLRSLTPAERAALIRSHVR
jgi:hypothetical protein